MENKLIFATVIYISNLVEFLVFVTTIQLSFDLGQNLVLFEIGVITNLSSLQLFLETPECQSVVTKGHVDSSKVAMCPPFPCQVTCVLQDGQLLKYKDLRLKKIFMKHCLIEQIDR